MRTTIKLVQLSYLPLVVIRGPDPPHVFTKPLQMVASGLPETSGHIRHVLEWSELFNVDPLMILAVLHGLHKLIQVATPLSAIQRGDLAGIETPNNMELGPSSNLRACNS